MRYSEVAASVSCISKSTFIPTMLESASIWKNWTASGTAWAAGIICELGKRAAVTTACRSMRSSKGRSRNRPAIGVRNEQGDRSKRRTSATSATSGFTVTGVRRRRGGEDARSPPHGAGGEGIDADGVAGGSEFALHVIDGEIALAHGHRQITDPIAGGRRLRSALRLVEEGGAFLRVVAELITQDAEGAGGIAEATGDVGGGLLSEEVSTEGFVLALHGELRGEEEVLVARCRYLIRSAGLHISMVLPKHEIVNMFGEERGCPAPNTSRHGTNCV